MLYRYNRIKTQIAERKDFALPDFVLIVTMIFYMHKKDFYLNLCIRCQLFNADILDFLASVFHSVNIGKIGKIKLTENLILY